MGLFYRQENITYFVKFDIPNIYSAETYGYRTNANGKALRNKQVWTLRPSGEGESVILKSHLDRYISVDQFGNVTCDQVGFVNYVFIKSMFNIFLNINKGSCRNIFSYVVGGQ